MAIVRVRPAVNNGLEDVVRIDSYARVDQASRALIETAIDRGECFVAFDRGRLLGYGIMNYSFFNRGFVSLTYIDTAHRRRRLGTSLFDEFERRCRSSRIFTSANLSNLPMQGFLASRGYILSGMVQDLDEGDPEMFYSKKVR